MVSLGARRVRSYDLNPVVVPRIGHDALLAFALQLPALFVTQLGSAGAALYLVGGALFALPYWRQLGRLMAPRAFLLIAPLLAIASVLWSDDPGATLRYGAQTLLTVLIGLSLSFAVKPKGMLFGLFAAYAVYVAVAIAFGRLVSGEYHGEFAFVGLSGGKNYMGDIAATGAIISAGVFAIALADRALFRLGLAAAVFVLEIYVTLLSRSAGALISVATGVLVLSVLVAAGRLPPNGRFSVAALTGLCLAGLAFAANFLRDWVSESAQQLFDKDPTLTGRTYLWYRAADVIRERPMLGHGYAAFWRYGNLDAEGLWRWAGVDPPTGFNFHNSYIELMVQLGAVGLVVVCAVFVVGVALLARRQLIRPSPVTAFWLAIVAFQLVRTPFEGIFLTPIDFSTMLLFAAFGSAFRGADPLPAPRLAARSMIRPLATARPAD